MDLDGTLRDQYGKIPFSTVKLLKHIQRHGVKVVVVTGKMLLSSRVFARQLGIKNLIICNHGAVVGDPVKNKILYEIRLPSSITAIINQFLKHFFGCQCYFSGNNQMHMVENPHVNIEERYHIKNGFKIKRIWKLDDHLTRSVGRLRPSKIIFYTPIGKEGVYMRWLKSKLKKRAKVYRTKPGNVEISPITVSKAKALNFVSKSLGVKPAQIIAIGDEENDIPMIKFAGLGVAMQNAHQSVKKAANYITTRSNEEKGVEEVINKFILNPTP